MCETCGNSKCPVGQPITDQLAERRADTAFMTRLHERVDTDKQILDRLT